LTEWSVKGGALAAKLVNREEKKGKIIFSALRVFSKKGISFSTISDIAKEANIGKGTVYEYFKSKDEIIMSVFRSFLDDGIILMNQIKNLSVLPDKKLLKGLHMFTDVIDGEGVETFKLLFDFWAIGIKEEKYSTDFYNHMKNFYREYRKIFSDIIKEGQDMGIFKKEIESENVGAMIIGMLDGLMAQWILDRDNIDYTGSVKTMAKLLVFGLKFNKNTGGKND
jgi:TetR/AcrR family fatty acid metabolism transcriptional regulator